MMIVVANMVPASGGGDIERSPSPFESSLSHILSGVAGAAEAIVFPVVRNR
jgi:hypothetical protein